jgi:NAD(P)-dependent dehydrogenase (short-subunit alcohol dehydrogenase family)
MDADQIRGAVAATLEHFGGIDILVNNAGGVRGGPFVTMPEQSMRRHVEINLVSTFVATQEVARAMIDAGNGGSIVNVASIEAFRAAPMYAVYAACKAGMVSFTRTMALELAEYRIRVNCIAPDHTVTPGLRGNRSGRLERVGRLVGGVVHGRAARPRGARRGVCQHGGVAVLEDVRLRHRRHDPRRRGDVGVVRMAAPRGRWLDARPVGPGGRACDTRRPVRCRGGWP